VKTDVLRLVAMALLMASPLSRAVGSLERNDILTFRAHTRTHPKEQRKVEGPSLEETIADINNKLVSTPPDWENPALQVTSAYDLQFDFDTHLGKDLFHETATIRVKDVRRLEIVHTSNNYAALALRCPGEPGQESRCATNTITIGVYKNPFHNQALFIGPFSPDPEQFQRMQRAVQHLLDLTRARQPKDTPDPFSR
jgi:hypothetical protein